jgi:hypothetical protein
MTPTAIPLQSDAALLVLGRLRSSEKPEARGLHIGKRSEFNGVLPANCVPAPMRSHLGNRLLSAPVVRPNCLSAFLVV